MKKQFKENDFMRRLAGAGLSPEQLAEFVGVSRATVYRWAAGDFLPNLDPVIMSRLCIALGCDTLFDLAKIFRSDAPSQFELLNELLEFKKDRNNP